MPHRADRLIALVPCVLGWLLTGAAGPAPAATSLNEEIVVRFDDIESRVRSASPRALAIAREFTVAGAERNAALHWSNPSLGYDVEDSEATREWQVAVRKRFEAPFAQGGRREGWDQRVLAAELRADQATRDLVAELKADYVRIRLLGDQLEHLERLASLVDMAATVAGDQHAEGHLSGMERQLVELAAYTVDAAGRRVGQEHRELLAAWRADLGIPAGAAVTLATPVAFGTAELLAAADYAAMLPGQPGYRSRTELALSLDSHAAAARPGLIPAFEVHAGYKRFDPDLDGFVAGVAVDLPLFDRGDGAAGRLTAERMLVESELAAATARAAAEIGSLVAAISEAQAPLSAFAGRLERMPPPTEALLLAYREGTLTVDALLGAVQVEAAALAEHHRELSTYYLNIFRLEAITGASIARFETGE